MLSRLSKNFAVEPVDRAAGELEGARPASNTIRRRLKKLALSSFFRYSILPFGKMLGGRSLSKKSVQGFFDKLKSTRRASEPNQEKRTIDKSPLM